MPVPVATHSAVPPAMASGRPPARTRVAPAIHWPVKYTKRVIPATASQPAVNYTTLEPLMDVPRWGVLSAIDLASGKIKWQRRTEQPLVGGLLATAGNLVFMGEGSGRFNAYDATTGEVLWSDQLDAGVNAPPITYRIDGRQYVAIYASGGKERNGPAGGVYLSFALPPRR